MPENDTPPMTIRYRFGIRPDHKITNDPGVFECCRAMDRGDLFVGLITLALPSLYGYRAEKNFSSFYFKFGFGTGLFAAAIYAYMRSYTRLTGIFVETPKIEKTE